MDHGDVTVGAFGIPLCPCRSSCGVNRNRPCDPLFTLFGLFGSTGGVLYAHIKELTPSAMVAMALTGMNFFVMLGAAIFIQGLGSLMQFLYPTASLSYAAFNAAFVGCASLLFLAGIAYVFTRESHEDRR